MTVYDLFLKCDNIKSGACFHLYKKEEVYMTHGFPYAARDIKEMDDEEQEATVKKFHVCHDGLTVWVLIN